MTVITTQIANDSIYISTEISKGVKKKSAVNIFFVKAARRIAYTSKALDLAAVFSHTRPLSESEGRVSTRRKFIRGVIILGEMVIESDI